MALPLTKKDFAGAGLSAASEGMDIMSGINKFMGSLNGTMLQAGKLLQGYGNIKEKLMPTQPPAPQHTQQPPIPPAARPTPPPPPASPPAPAANPEDKKAKAEALFNELHALVKPHLLMAKTISVADAVQYALQPANKEQIISKIAERL